MNFKQINDSDYKMINIRYAIRYLDKKFFIFSLLYVLTLIYTLNFFTFLPNTRTKMLKNVFGAMIAQVLSCLIIYLNQFLMESETGIAHTPIVCEICYIILQWASTCFYTWILVAGMYLRQLNLDRPIERFKFHCYFYLAWSMPNIFTVVWIAFTLQNYNNANWFGYKIENTYMIMQMPQLLAILNNIVNLLFILKDLYFKIEENKKNTKEIMMSFTAAAILIPMLLTINITKTCFAPTERTSWNFAIWSGPKNFLGIFLGAFLVIYYKFLNRVVRGTFKRKVKEVTFFGDDIFANRKRENAQHDILAVETNMPFLVKPAPPPPFFRISAEGVPTTKQKCGCAPRFDIHETNCLLAHPSHFDLNDGQDVNTEQHGDDMLQDNGNDYFLPPPIPPKASSSGIQVEEIVLKMVIGPDIHKPSTSLLSVGMTALVDIELEETSV